MRFHIIFLVFIFSFSTFAAGKFSGKISLKKKATVKGAVSAPASNVSVVQTAFLDTNASGDTISITATTAGNTLVVIGFFPWTAMMRDVRNNSPGGSDTFLKVGEVNHGSGATMWIYYAKNIRGGATSISFNASDFIKVWVAEVSGLDKEDPLIGSSLSQGDSDGTIATAGPLAVQENSGIMFTGLISSETVTGINPGNPFTSMHIYDGDDVGYYKFTSAGSYGGQWIQNTSGYWTSASVAFKAADSTGIVGSNSPKLIQTINSVTVDGTTRITNPFQVEAGDVLIAYSMSADSDAASLDVPTGSGIVWTPINSIDISGFSEIRAWYAIAPATKALTITFTSDSWVTFRSDIMIFRNSSGVGVNNKSNVASGSPTISLTPSKANSSVVVINADWLAISGNSRIWDSTAGTVLDASYFFQNGSTTLYSAVYPNVGAISSKNFGLTAPVAQKYSIMAIEVKGL